ncbi:hypothetical protein PHAVU_007G145700 [Phaseolus vulgaris]|uniref:Uncharacterized protein n=1 Tax=Phaseolus vulgaris TaxID=3885 RepID=V7BHF5_PHAVU|nr:hypothetical protein PHAVU_007G145700g [Phaseolus vulgaris]ESW16308.1 hypothetical protein PHAVU_007G145700g [Phaseolus vulgaris]
MGALTQRQEAVTSSNDEFKKRILHHTLSFITFFQRKNNDELKLSSHSSKAKLRLRKRSFKAPCTEVH